MPGKIRQFVIERRCAMAKSRSSSSSGIGFFGAMFLLFLGLKLCGVIQWSWWLVTIPLWGGLALIVIVAIVMVIVMVIVVSVMRLLKGGG